jgi:hypothetical protein
MRVKRKARARCVLAAALALGWGVAQASPNVTLSVTVVPTGSSTGAPSSVALTQSVPDGLASIAQTDRQLSVSAIPDGQTVFGVILSENNGQPGSNGSLDVIKVGSQTGTVIRRYQDARYQGDGLGITVWWLQDVQGSPTTI